MTEESFAEPLHSIRLRGPWQYEVLQRVAGADAAKTGRVKMPTDWSGTLGNDFRGTVRYSRNFSLPTGLTDDDRLVLAIDAVDYQATIRLNGRMLGTMKLPDRCAYFEVTDQVQQRNVLQVDVTLPIDLDATAQHNRSNREGLAGGLIGEVRLEIG